LDRPQALMRSLAGESTLEITTDRPADDDAVAGLAALTGVERVERLQTEAAPNGGPPGAPAAPAQPQPLRVRLYLSGEASLLVAPAAAALAQRGLALSDVRLGTPTLEDVFIHLTGRTLR